MKVQHEGKQKKFDSMVFFVGTHGSYKLEK